MTIPEKGSRRIRVGDTEYSWRIRKQPTYSQLIYQSPMCLAVQVSTEGPRSVLLVNLRVSRPDGIYPHQTALKPAMIRDIVTRALAQGWVPTGGGLPFSLDYPLIKDDA